MNTIASRPRPHERIHRLALAWERRVEQQKADERSDQLLLVPIAGSGDPRRNAFCGATRTRFAFVDVSGAPLTVVMQSDAHETPVVGAAVTGHPNSQHKGVSRLEADEYVTVPRQKMDPGTMPREHLETPIPNVA